MWDNIPDLRPYTRWWFHIFVVFTPILGVSWSNLTCAYFSDAWFNHQLVICFFKDSKITVASEANVAFWVRHTKATVKTFSPLQLARTIHGFGIAGVEDPALYRQLCNDTVLDWLRWLLINWDTWLIEMCNDCLVALIDWDDYCIEKLFWLVEEAAVCTWCRSRSWESYWPIS